MSDDSIPPTAGDPARRRWLAIVLTRLIGSAGAVFGVVLLARADDDATRVLAVGIVLSALYFIAVVPRALARRWRSPRG